MNPDYNKSSCRPKKKSSNKWYQVMYKYPGAAMTVNAGRYHETSPSHALADALFAEPPGDTATGAVVLELDCDQETRKVFIYKIKRANPPWEVVFGAGDAGQ
jgi:hypothetical protein